MPLLKHNKQNHDTQHGNHSFEPGNLTQHPTSGHGGMHLGQHVDPPLGVHDSAGTTVDSTSIPETASAVAKKQSTGAGEKAFVGRLEHAVGTILCSSTLRAKGIQKEREAKALKVQVTELNAAERLEGEALLHRQRAVAHGADPQLLYHDYVEPQNQPATVDMSTAVDSGAENLAGVGSVAGPADWDTFQAEGIPQQGLSTSQVARGSQELTDGNLPQGAMQQTAAQVPHAAHMAPRDVQGTGVNNEQLGYQEFNGHSHQVPTTTEYSRYPGIGVH